MQQHPRARALLVTLDGAPPPTGIAEPIEWWPAARWLLQTDGPTAN